MMMILNLEIHFFVTKVHQNIYLTGIRTHSSNMNQPIFTLIAIIILADFEVYL